MPECNNGPYVEQRTFTAAEVQAAVRAVILYERERAERQLRMLSATLEQAIRSSRREVDPNG